MVGQSSYVNVVVPVYNGATCLYDNISQLHRFLSTQAYEFEIVIVNNGSTDSSGEVATSLAERLDDVHVIHLDEKGRGRAIKLAWSSCRRDDCVLAYMDVDLSSDLQVFPRLVGSLFSGEFDLAVGSRLLNPKSTTRCLRREIVSRVYNLLVKVFFRTRFSDAQCGFKAITVRAARILVPLLKDDYWFMDTELLVLAETLGFRIFDTPVRWIENKDSRVNVVATAFEDIKALFRLRSRLKSEDLVLQRASETSALRR